MNIIRRQASASDNVISISPSKILVSKNRDSIRKQLLEVTMDEMSGLRSSREFTLSKKPPSTLLIDKPPPFDFSQVPGYTRPKRKAATLNIFETLE